MGLDGKEAESTVTSRVGLDPVGALSKGQPAMPNFILFPFFCNDLPCPTETRGLKVAVTRARLLCCAGKTSRIHLVALRRGFAKEGTALDGRGAPLARTTRTEAFLVQKELKSILLVRECLGRLFAVAAFADDFAAFACVAHLLLKGCPGGVEGPEGLANALVLQIFECVARLFV